MAAGWLLKRTGGGFTLQYDLPANSGSLMSSAAPYTPHLPRIAVALGDPAGIGPEIALKAALDPSVRAICQPVLFGDRGVLEMHARACGLAPRLQSVASAAGADTIDSDTTALVERPQFKPGELQLGELAAAHGLAALEIGRAHV